MVCAATAMATFSLVMYNLCAPPHLLNCIANTHAVLLAALHACMCALPSSSCQIKSAVRGGYSFHGDVLPLYSTPRA